MSQYTDVIRIGMDFHKSPNPHVGFRMGSAPCLPTGAKGASPWQTAVPSQAVIAENEAWRRKAITPNLYEIPIPQASIPSRKNMPLVAGTLVVGNRRSEGAKPFHPLLMHIDDASVRGIDCLTRAACRKEHPDVGPDHAGHRARLLRRFGRLRLCL
jgi:hypothetical protein